MSHANKRHGLVVLVTRPGEAGMALCEEIRKEGGEAIFFPTLTFAPPDDVASFETAIGKISEQDYVIFNSPQAVVSSVPFIKREYAIWPEHVKIVAIGGGTAKALREMGLPVDIQPDRWSSEGVLDLPIFQSVIEKKFAIVRGEGGRKVLDQVFYDRGAHVLPIIAYKRTVPENSTLTHTEIKKTNTIVVTSCEGIVNLKTMVGDTNFTILTSAQLIVVSTRIKALAERLGFRTIWITSTPSHDAILAVLLEIAAKQKGKHHDR